MLIIMLKSLNAKVMEISADGAWSSVAKYATQVRHAGSED